MIINYEKFLTYNKNMLNEEKDCTGHKYGCVMIYLHIDNWNNIISTINIDDVYQSNDITQYPHITALYGLKDSVTENDIKDILDKYKDVKFNIEVDGIDIFENDDFDVVKMNIKSNILHQLNSDLRNLPYVSDYPDYKPHVTIGFVKPGEGKKYINISYTAKLDNNIKYVLFTKPDGTKCKFDI